GGAAWKLGDGTTPALSPDGRTVAYAKDGQIHSYAIGAGGAGRAGGSGGAGGSSPLVKAWGTNGTPVWSPDGSKFAFVSNRVDHSLIGVYDARTRAVTFLSPS